MEGQASSAIRTVEVLVSHHWYCLLLECVVRSRCSSLVAHCCLVAFVLVLVLEGPGLRVLGGSACVLVTFSDLIRVAELVLAERLQEAHMVPGESSDA